MDRENLPKRIFSEDLEQAVERVSDLLPAEVEEEQKRWYAVKLLEQDEKVMGRLENGSVFSYECGCNPERA